MSAEMAARVRFRGRHAHRRRERLEAYAVTTSHLPGTTLQAVRVPCFASFKHALWDTPGIINRHNIRNHHFPGAKSTRPGPCMPLAPRRAAPHARPPPVRTVHLMEPLALPRKIELRAPLHLRAGESLLLEAAWMEPGWAERGDRRRGGESCEHPIDDVMPLPIDDVIPDATASAPMALARVDASSLGDAGQQPIEARAAIPTVTPPLRPRPRPAPQVRLYASAAVRARVVATADAPSVAAPPPEFARRIFDKARRMSARADETFDAFLRRCRHELRPYKEHLDVHAAEHACQRGHSVDVCFAGVGWLSFHRRGRFAVRPFCVDGSHWYKRAPFYTRNLERQLDETDYTFTGSSVQGRSTFALSDSAREGATHYHRASQRRRSLTDDVDEEHAAQRRTTRGAAHRSEDELW
jgi:hypothetical protein